jgi:O-antigen/teichoic acid export membrane protein
MGITQTIAKNTVFSFIATGTETVSMIAVGIVLARYLGTEQYGLYSLLMQFLSLALFVVNLGMGEMIKRFVAEAIGQNNVNSVKGFVRLTLTIRTSAGLLASIVIIILANLFAKLYGIPGDDIYFMLVGACFLPYVLIPTLQGIFAGYQKYEYGAYMSLIISTLRALAGIVMAVLGYGVIPILIMYTAIWVLGVIIGFILVNRLTPLRGLLTPSLLDSPTRNSALKYSLAAMGMLGVDYFLWQQPEVMLLGIYRPMAEVGFYTLAQKVPTIAINIIPFVFGSTLLPAIAEQFGKGDMGKIRTIYRNAARYLMMLSFPLAAGGIALARPINELLYGPEYSPAILLMQLVFIPFALWGLTHAVSSVIYGIRQPTLLLKIGAVLIVINVGLDFWLIPKYGAYGAVAATSIPRMLSLPIYIYFVSRKINERWPMADTLKIVLASIITGLATFVLQRTFGLVLSLVLGVTAGIILYIVALLVLRAVKPEDLQFLKKVEKRVPSILRQQYSKVINQVAVFVR